MGVASQHGVGGDRVQAEEPHGCPRDAGCGLVQHRQCRVVGRQVEHGADDTESQRLVRLPAQKGIAGVRPQPGDGTQELPSELTRGGPDRRRRGPGVQGCIQVVEPGAVADLGGATGCSSEGGGHLTHRVQSATDEGGDVVEVADLTGLDGRLESSGVGVAAGG